MHSTADASAHPPVFEQGLLDVGDGHSLYWRVHGNTAGPVVVILHGGPGSGHNPKWADFFDPAIWRIVLYDQRGCGKSTPFASTEHNTLVELVADMELLRLMLSVDRWCLFGGSWGTRLALAYGIAHPDRCAGFLLRGVFLGRACDIRWFLWDVQQIFPQEHARFCDAIAACAGRRPQSFDELLALATTVFDPAHPQRYALAAAWDAYEGQLISVSSLPAPVSPPADAPVASTPSADAKGLALATLEHHYITRVLPHEPDVLAQLAGLAHLPCEIVHGRYDMVCPVQQAWDLAQAWPAATLRIAPASGHWTFEPNMVPLLHDGSAALLRAVR